MSYESSNESQVPAQKQFGCLEGFSYRCHSISEKMIRNHDSKGMEK